MVRRRVALVVSSVIVVLVSLSVGVVSAAAWRDHSHGGDLVLIEPLDRVALRREPEVDVGAAAVQRAPPHVATPPLFEPAAPERRAHLDQLDAPTAEQATGPAERAATRPLVPASGTAAAVSSAGLRAAPAAARAQETLVAEAIQRWGRGGLLLAIPRLGVSAAVSGLGYEADGRTPATPASAWGVGWYQFTAYPGTGGNAVLSGHVDWYTGAPAVLAGLSTLGVGDTIAVVLPDGSALTYQVASAQAVQPETANVAAIFGATGQEALTLITCGGAWDPVAHDYSHRLIVRAYRVR